ncbi:MAG: tRNA threonylcarbamoyladenosine dehydratase [Oscillospiraceae bacterium]|nr:tRNA threonylcarbamoyladenosine dehydratase [Oscillospiraceae bacterium]
MTDQFSRTRMLLGGAAMEKLERARVAVIGLGGVGSFALEALVRSGVGAFELVDNDVVSLTNLNRQLLALHSTLGLPKVEVAAQRAWDINPAVEIRTLPLFVTAENVGELPLGGCDYIVDAIDTVSAKIALVLRARELGVPILSAMGTGNKRDPAALRLADLSETANDPLARVMRKELRRRGVEHLKVLYSTELPHTEEAGEETKGDPPRPVPGSTAFVPPAAGLMIAAEIVKELCEK